MRGGKWEVGSEMETSIPLRNQPQSPPKPPKPPKPHPPHTHHQHMQQQQDNREEEVYELKDITPASNTRKAGASQQHLKSRDDKKHTSIDDHDPYHYHNDIENIEDDDSDISGDVDVDEDGDYDDRKRVSSQSVHQHTSSSQLKSGGEMNSVLERVDLNPNVSLLKDMFPQFDVEMLNFYLEKHKHDLSETVNALLVLPTPPSPKVNRIEGPSNNSIPHVEVTVTLPESQERVPTLGKINSVQNIVVQPKLVTASSQQIIDNEQMKKPVKEILPPNFLLPPRSRFVIEEKSYERMRFTVYFNRNIRSLDINVRQIGDNIYVYELYLNRVTGKPGIAQEAGILQGDMLIGVNFEYFPDNTPLDDIAKIISGAGQFFSLQFVRDFNKSRLSKRLSSSTATLPRRAVHPCAVVLLAQEVIKMENVPNLCETLERLKAKVLDWHSGQIKQRLRIKDVKTIQLKQNWDSIFDTSDETMDTGRLDRKLPTKKSFIGSVFSNTKSKQPNDQSTLVTVLSNTADTWREIELIRSKWFRDIVYSTTEIQPAFSFHVLTGVYRHDHVGYLIWATDTLTGLEWTVYRRYSDFLAFKEELVSLWSIFSQFEFPKRRLSVAVDTSTTINERLPILNLFLMKVYEVIVVGPFIHPKAKQLYILLQDFIDAPFRFNAIRLLEAHQNESTPEDAFDLEDLCYNREEKRAPAVPNGRVVGATDLQKNNVMFCARKWVDIYIQNVLHTRYFQLIIRSFMVHFQEEVIGYLGDDHETNYKLKCEKCFKSLSTFLDNMQNIVEDGLTTDSLEILQYYLEKDLIQKERAKSIDHSDDTLVPDVGMSSTLRATLSLDDINDSLETDGMARSIVYGAVRRQLEIEIYVQANEIMKPVLNKAFGVENSVLYQKCVILSNMPQSFFGIQLEFISPSSWFDVVEQFHMMRDKTIPFDKIQALLAAASEIPRQYYRERCSAEKSLGADDILPIFIYSLVMSKNQYLVSIARELDAYCDPHNRVSESGYYIATLQASLQYILEIDEANGFNLPKLQDRGVIVE